MDRKTAKSLHMMHYNTGNPCIKGHLSDRYTSTGNCVKCVNDASKNYRTTNKKQKMAAIVGDVIIENRVHMRDVDALRAFVDALNRRRRVIYDTELRASIAASESHLPTESHLPPPIPHEPFLPPIPTQGGFLQPPPPPVCDSEDDYY